MTRIVFPPAAWRRLAGPVVLGLFLALQPAAGPGNGSARADVSLFGEDDLYKAAVKGSVLDMSGQLVRGVSANLRSTKGEPVLVAAARGDHAAAIRLLIENGAALEAADAEGATALIRAAEVAAIDALRALLAAGANPNAIDRAGETALMKATRSGVVEAVRALLAGRADATITDFSGRGPLTIAREVRRPAIADMLKAAGATE